jgi:hypothetical protein
VRSDGSDRRQLVSSYYHPGVYSPSGRRVALYYLGHDNARNVKCGDIFNVTAPRRPWQPPVPSLTHNCEGYDPQIHFTGLAMEPSWQPIPRG